MSVNIVTTSQIPRYIKSVIYGAPGVGKTVLGATAPAPLILDAESGTLSIARQHVDMVEITDLKTLKETYDFLNKSDHKYETVVLDPVTELADVLLEAYKPLYKDARQAYGQMATEMKEVMRLFRELPMHVVFNAHQEIHNDEFSGLTTYRPSAPGQAFTGKMAYFYDIVGCMRIGKKGKDSYRYLQTQPDFQYQAKDRTGVLDAKEENPNLSILFHKIISSFEGE